MTTTQLAYCGRCASPVRLVHTPRGWRYGCAVCLTGTTPRDTPQQAAEDVVWAAPPMPPRPTDATLQDG